MELQPVECRMESSLMAVLSDLSTPSQEPLDNYQAKRSSPFTNLINGLVYEKINQQADQKTVYNFENVTIRALDINLTYKHSGGMLSLIAIRSEAQNIIQHR